MGDHYKNKAIYFEGGRWGGKRVRADLHELQHANLGRKYAEVDRRSIDPPPVALLRLFERTPPSQYGSLESEIFNYENVGTMGLLCAVDLIPVIKSGSGGHIHPTCDISGPRINHPHYDNDHLPSGVEDFSLTENLPVPESEIARLTTNVLIGSKVVQPHLIERNGQKNLMFVFSDLAVRNLGSFRLRYRFFDLFSTMPGKDTTIQAECIGGTFKVFSTKDFPGLEVSTELTKELSAQGVPLNVRNSERKIKTRNHDRTQATPN
ncbi:MAG: velvet factor [Lentinula lateritia]|uniref:Velvet factor n=1 Tax=Lentinula lateritia TaxID=40482 RepID=A0ABQ8V2D8_9AGAR|nr:MAG: velvet factor [Lentinula lateritia]KAJ4470538.1 velvet factor [Lentinula lateritia]